ncbi:MAG: protoporphyrinogen oxidase [Vicinamibacterales bacterium]
MKRIVIAGGGIAGLSIAIALKKKEPAAEILVLERAPKPGGNIRTEQIDGFTCEAGPNGFLDNAPETWRLIRDLNLEPRVLPSNDAARRRFIVRRGRLREVPTSPASLLTTSALSTRGKLRVALEPFAGRRVDDDESIDDFAVRHIGREAAEILVGSMVSGMFAGDARALSLRACFPRMHQMEEEHGSLVRALLANRQKQGGRTTAVPGGRLTSLIGGMTELINGLTFALGGSIRTSTAVRMLWPQGGTSRDGQFAVATSSGAIQANAVVLAGAAADSAALVRGFDPMLSDLLGGIPTAPLAVVCVGYPAALIEKTRALNGFGFLVPRGEPFRILGAVWESSIYRNRAPAGKALLRVMVGGALDRGAVALTDHQLLEVVQRDLAAVMGVKAAPEFVHIVRHTRGIPQYVRGHLARLRDIEERLRSVPGLFLAGNSYRALSMNACIAEASGVADAVLKHVNREQAALALV